MKRTEICVLKEVAGHIEADCESIQGARQLCNLLQEEVIIRTEPPGTLRITFESHGWAPK